MPGYEPRTLHAMALGLAVNARGADHNRSGAYEADLSGDLDRLEGSDAHVAAAVETEDRAAVMDSLILCKFLRGVFTDPFTEWAGLLSAVTGWEVSGGELRNTARRIVMAAPQVPAGAYAGNSLVLAQFCAGGNSHGAGAGNTTAESSSREINHVDEPRRLGTPAPQRETQNDDDTRRAGKCKRGEQGIPRPRRGSPGTGFGATKRRQARD